MFVRGFFQRQTSIRSKSWDNAIALGCQSSIRNIHQHARYRRRIIAPETNFHTNSIFVGKKLISGKYLYLESRRLFSCSTSANILERLEEDENDNTELELDYQLTSEDMNTNNDSFGMITKTNRRPRLEALREKLRVSSSISENTDAISFQQAKTMSSPKSIDAKGKNNKAKSSSTVSLPPQPDVKELLHFLREQDKREQHVQHVTSEMLTDKYRRFHSYLRISLTERCNFRCLYCMPPEGVPLQPKDDLLTSDEIVKLTTLFSQAGVDKIRLTGGEPLIHPKISSIINSISSLPTIRSVGVTTNGLTLSRQLPELLSAGLTHVNISLDTLQKDKFLEITRRNGFDKVMQAIDDAAASSIGTFQSKSLKATTDLETANFTSTGRVKVNCVVMKGFNDNELRDFVMLTKDKNVDVRFIEWMPFQENGWNQGRFLSYKDMLDRIQTDCVDHGKIGPIEMNRISDGPNDTTKWYHVPNHKGRIGFITSMTEHFCSSCNRLRITADGKLKVCLFGAKEVSLRDVMRMDDCTEEDLVRVINATVKDKTFALGGYGNAEGIAEANSNRPMTLIGG